MRWCGLIVTFAVLTAVLAAPDPKKFKPGTKDVPSKDDALSDEERKFLREVEAKFGIKSEIPVEKEETESDKKDAEKETDKEDKEVKPVLKPPFPAVIAIEIVNDTDSDGKPSKGKRTIDANLGYGYRTNNGYSYTYFGNPSQEKGKYMIYPYSQEDIPPRVSEGKQVASEVEIQPSQAFELVPVKNNEQTSYDYKKPQIEFKTKYENVQGLHSPPPPYPENAHSSHRPSSILYTTYNGEKFLGLQSNFPKVMSNYLVEPSQLLQNSQYQSAGLTKDYIQTHGQQLQQRVVPVLVLRIPSSYLKNPSAELYANSPQNYQTSNYLNNADLQQLVNQYFKKIGYPFAPQIMSYQNSAPTHSSPISNYEPQQYAHPYVQPSYTHSDYSGLQYSAVQPVMAKYPGLQNYYKQQYHSSPSQPLYQQPLRQHNYEYRYQYMHQPASINPQTYYVQQQYQTPQTTSHEQTHEVQTNAHVESAHDAASSAEYEAPQQQYSNHESSEASLYENPKYQNVQQYEEVIATAEPSYETPKHSYAEYESPKGEKLELNSGEVLSQQGGPTKVSISSSYGQPKQASHYTQELTPSQSYYSQQSEQPVQKETKTITIYPSLHVGQATKYIVRPESGSVQSYVYQKHVGEDSASQSLVISENYPSKDHTQAHTDVLPSGYKSARPMTEAQQTVSYVTPEPTNKYQSKYQVMVPQTVFKNPEHVSYVNSHSLPMHYTLHPEQNPEEEYTVSHQHVPPVGSQKPSGYPKNYHSHKRMTNKSDAKQEAAKKEHSEKMEQKKSA